MKIRNLILPFLIVGLTIISAMFLSGCSSMKESVKARKMLEKCGYSLKEIQLELIDFNSTVSFDNSSKQINVANPGKEVLTMLDEIRKGNFSLDLSKLRFNAVIEISNPNNVEVALDSLKLKTYLDDAFLVDVRHLEHTTIPPNSTVATNISIILPSAFPLKELFSAEDLVLKGNKKIKELIKYATSDDVKNKFMKSIKSKF
jgi:LEA14-like dessication related protein